MTNMRYVHPMHLAPHPMTHPMTPHPMTMVTMMTLMTTITMVMFSSPDTPLLQLLLLHLPVLHLLLQVELALSSRRLHWRDPESGMVTGSSSGKYHAYPSLCLAIFSLHTFTLQKQVLVQQMHYYNVKASVYKDEVLGLQNDLCNKQRIFSVDNNLPHMCGKTFSFHLLNT